MAYMEADTYRQVGFRPYGQTNPRGATQLSGMNKSARKTLGQVRAFDPWILHGTSGLGQGRPFDQDPGGWVLHGLGQEVDPFAAENPQEAALQDLIAKGIIDAGDAQAVRDGNLTIEDVTGAPDPLDESSWSGVLDLFAKANDELLSLEQQVRDDPAFAQAVARDVVQARTRYTDLASQYIEVYGTVFGSTPHIPGLGYLGVGPVAWVILAAAAAATFVLLYMELKALIAFLESRPTMEQQASIQLALKKGDPETARKIADQLKPPPPPKPKTDFLAWVQDNAKWIALAGVGIVVAGPMAEGLFGGRRRR